MRSGIKPILSTRKNKSRPHLSSFTALNKTPTNPSQTYAQIHKTRSTLNNSQTRNQPKVYTASLSCEDLVPDKGVQAKNEELIEGEVSHDDSMLDSILIQMKSDKKNNYSNAKAIEMLTEVNMGLLGQVQAMKKQMEWIQLSQAERETAQVEASLTMDRKKTQVMSVYETSH